MLGKAKRPNNPWAGGVLKKKLKIKCTNGQQIMDMVTTGTL
jgi:hypothetical protein